MKTYTPEELSRAKRHEEAAPLTALGTPRAVYFDWWLAGPNGAGFMLFREPHHTAADIDAARRYLLAERDVVTLEVRVPT